MKLIVKAASLAVIAAAMLTGCGAVEKPSESKAVEDTSSVIEKTETKAPATTTNTVTSSSKSSSVTTTSIVTGTDKNGKVTTLIIGEDGRILSTFKNGSTTSKAGTSTTSKATAKTTTKSGSSNNNAQNNGNNGGYSYNNNSGNNEQDNNNNNNYNSNNDNNNYSPAPEQTKPQTQAPQTKPATTTTQQQNDQSVSIDTADLDDTLKAYLRFGRGDKVSSYDWELIRKDICDYILDKYNGKSYFEFDEGGWGTYVAEFAAPLNLSVNTSWTDYSHAHLNCGSGTNLNAVFYYDIRDAKSNDDLYNIATRIRDDERSIGDKAIETWHSICEDDGYFDNAKLAPLCSELPFNIGIMDDGFVWFLTE